MALRLAREGLDRGKNPLVEYRYVPDRLPTLAAELVTLTPESIVAQGPEPALALKSATATIPIVLVTVYDPVRIGLVQSLSHPGGNITGLATSVPGEMLGKDVEILRELIPGAAKIALLVNPQNTIHRQILAAELQRAARSLGVALPTVEATNAEALDVAFASAVAQRADAISVLADIPTTILHGKENCPKGQYQPAGDVATMSQPTTQTNDPNRSWNQIGLECPGKRVSQADVFIWPVRKCIGLRTSPALILRRRAQCAEKPAIQGGA